MIGRRDASIDETTAGATWLPGSAQQEPHTGILLPTTTVAGLLQIPNSVNLSYLRVNTPVMTHIPASLPPSLGPLVAPPHVIRLRILNPHSPHFPGIALADPIPKSCLVSAVSSPSLHL